MAMHRSVEQQSAAIFQKYASLNKRRIEDLVEKKGYDLSIKLYQATPVATKARIRRDAEKYKFAWLTNVRKGMKIWEGTKAASQTVNTAALNLSRRLPGEKDDYNAATRLAEFVIRLRIHAIYFMACGWLPKNWVMRGSGDEREPVLKNNQHRRGKVTIEGAGTAKCRVFITNETDGIETLEARKPFVKKAIKAWNADMIRYIGKKLLGQSGKSVGGVN